MNSTLSKRERAHLHRVKEQPCSVCGAPGPSQAHHIEQGLHYLTIALCYECHQGDSGRHGTKALWRVRKMDELKALNVTLSRLQA